MEVTFDQEVHGLDYFFLKIIKAYPQTFSKGKSIYILKKFVLAVATYISGEQIARYAHTEKCLFAAAAYNNSELSATYVHNGRF